MLTIRSAFQMMMVGALAGFDLDRAPSEPNRNGESMKLSRRHFLQVTALAPLFGACRSHADDPKATESTPMTNIAMMQRTIPSSSESIPVVGLGTYQAFSALDDPKTRDRLAEVLTKFHQLGGRFIDSSPMYGPAESTVGELLSAIPQTDRQSWFLATKVWTDGKSAGITQMTDSAKKMGVTTIDLMQVHNLRDWSNHLPTLKAWKAEGKIRYLGITTSDGRDHAGLIQLMKSEPLDFVQFTYNVDSREAENVLLPLAKDRGIATIINRPFGQGSLLKQLSGRPLPEWVTSELQCDSWAQALLKFILADERVTVVIPATSNPKHLVDNMGAGSGPMPNSEQKARLLKEIL